MNIADYNAEVHSQANQNVRLRAFKDQFRALISTQTVHARDNTDTAPANGSSYAPGEGVPIYWMNVADPADEKFSFNYDCLLRDFPRNQKLKVKEKVADDYADFYDGVWDSHCARIHSGGIAGKDRSWTGSNSDGTRHPLKYAGQDTLRLGQFFSPLTEIFDPLPDPISSYDGAKAQSHRIYALSPVLTVRAGSIPPPTGFTATDFSDTEGSRVTLRWTISSRYASKWQYRQRQGTGNASKPYGDWTDIPASNADTAFYHVTGLEEDTTYTFQVRGVENGNVGAASIERSARTGSVSLPSITDVRLRAETPAFAELITGMGHDVRIEVEYAASVNYTAVPQFLPLTVSESRGGGVLELARYSDGNLRKAHYKGERSKFDFNSRYAELVPDLVWAEDDDGSWTMPATEGKVVTYKYTVRWSDFDDDGVSFVRPDTGAVMSSHYRVDGSTGMDPYLQESGLSYCEEQEIDKWIKDKEDDLGKTVLLWYRDMSMDGPVAYRHAWDALEAASELCFGDRERREKWEER